MGQARTEGNLRERPVGAGRGARQIEAMEERTTEAQHAKEAGLRYVNDSEPGISREAHGKEFRFRDAKGKLITAAEQVRRIKSLAIPPAWTEVWICADPDGHLQATGRDARGRKQHRYHKRWREARDETKYNRMIDFAKALPKVRDRISSDLAKQGLPREKVLAAIVKILETGAVRVGNDEYARTNNSFGLTTMQDRHAKVSRRAIRFEFRGKSGKHHKVRLEDKRLARIVKHCQDIPGQELFQYVDDRGRNRDVTSTDVNQYLREITGGDFTAKDFRTWAGTVLAAMALREVEKFDTKAQAKKNIVRAIENVAERLGNTPSICKKCYVHPFVLDAYMDGSLLEQVVRERALNSKKQSLQPEEAMVVRLLERRLDAQRKYERGGGLLKQLQASVKHRKKAARCPSR